MHLPPDVDDELTVEIAHCHSETHRACMHTSQVGCSAISLPPDPMLSSPPFRKDGPSPNAPQGCGEEDESDEGVAMSHIVQGEALQQIFAKQRETILKDRIITNEHLQIMRGWHAQDAEVSLKLDQMHLSTSILISWTQKRKQEKIEKNLRFKNARMRRRRI